MSPHLLEALGNLYIEAYRMGFEHGVELAEDHARWEEAMGAQEKRLESQ